MLAQLLFDFGLVILIWMTQLIVYPSFTKMNLDNLFEWHTSYTGRISILVMPLMIGQLGLHIYGLTQTLNSGQIAAFLFVILAWINTFFYAVPLHNQIAGGKEISQAAKHLVSVNRWRTGFWSIAFIFDLLIFTQLL